MRSKNINLGQKFRHILILKSAATSMNKIQYNYKQQNVKKIENSHRNIDLELNGFLVLPLLLLSGRTSVLFVLYNL